MLLEQNFIFKKESTSLPNLVISIIMNCFYITPDVKHFKIIHSNV